MDEDDFKWVANERKISLLLKQLIHCDSKWFLFLVESIKFGGFNSFKPECTIVIFIRYKPQITAAVVEEDDLKWVANEKKMLLLRELHENVRSKPQGS